ncbi:hypothetical protein ACI77I_23880 [Pseudomonas sp. D47]|jgi:hypothetical protein|uniref:hypothetical protein n=1 Tax=Pseudomonas sp. D47 TaxID=3159447 RepID=UPI00387B5378
MAMIDSDRLKFFLGAAQDAKATWVAAGKVLVGVDRYDRAAWEQAQLQVEQALNVYNSKARDVTTLVMLLIEQAEYEACPVEG